MTDSVSLPVWLVIIVGAFAVWAFFDRIFFPFIRWYFRRRTRRIIAEVNERLDLRLPAFKTIRRRVLIDQLIYDPHIQAAVEEYSQEQGISYEKAQEKVKVYARETVPSFNAYLYFRLGSWMGRSFSRLLYRVRAGFVDEEGLAKIDRNSSLVFVMNHRSNMDYILLAYLAIKRVALSFAVGEWARIWPIQHLIRALGAYFVRRGSRDYLYRRVLARYVQMATEAGVVQAIFPEGRQSRDGQLGEPKIGLLDYILRNFDPKKERDLVFIPVGVNYDRVLEDRSLLLSMDPKAKKKSKVGVIKTTLLFVMHNIWLMLRGGWHRFGYAVVNFGTPISMRSYTKRHRIDFSSLSKEDRIEKVKSLTADLMGAIGRVIPVVPVSMIASIFAENPGKAFSDLELKAHVQRLIDDLEAGGARVYIPRHDRGYAVEVGLRMLLMRHLVSEENSLYQAVPEEMSILRFYAGTIAHHLS